MNVREYNRTAWNRNVDTGNQWTVPVGPDAIAAARKGEWSIVLTPTKPVPRAWFPPLDGLEVLCLASGGGQKGPILAAAGANVTAFDNSNRTASSPTATGYRGVPRPAGDQTIRPSPNASEARVVRARTPVRLGSSEPERQ